MFWGAWTSSWLPPVKEGEGQSLVQLTEKPMKQKLKWGLTLLLLMSSPFLRPMPAGGQTTVLRRVHAPYFANTVRWAEAGIFWFGRVDSPSNIGQNYLDVRVAYTEEELVIYANIEDYFVWYDRYASSSSDLTQYDAVAVYLDTAYDQATTPQNDDYFFLNGLCLYGCGDGTNHRREARGTGLGWETAWAGNWFDETWAQWGCNTCPSGTCGPNSPGACGLNFGWDTKLHMPWSTFGLSGPPSEGTVWGLGVILYDRDGQPPAGQVAPQGWPETFSTGNPSTWGELVFGLANYEPPQPAHLQGTTIIRRGVGSSIVEDAWVGGGGTCSGGHEGNPDQDNHGSDTSLFVENQDWITDFPCFSKTFLRFHLNAIPPDKVIISATLRIHQWSNARWDEANPSLIWLFSTDNNWQENTLTWNNAPLARENLTTTWVDVITPENNPGLPGVPYEWNATQAVAEAYAAREPLNIALYTADMYQHSSKYLLSSDAVSAYADARPTLTVTWGEPLATVHKRVQPVAPAHGTVVSYTLSLLGNGQALTLADELPSQVSVPGTIQVLGGPAAHYDPGTHQVSWSGSPAAGQPVTITFPVIVQVTGPLAVFNTAVLTDTEGHSSTSTAILIVDAHKVWLPLQQVSP